MSPESQAATIDSLVKLLMKQILLGAGISAIMLPVTNPALFFILFFFAVAAFFLINSGINLLLIKAVPEQSKPMASALSVVLIHLFGDVPSPILLGALSDRVAPLTTLSVALFTVLFAVAIWSAILFLPDHRKAFY